MLTPTVWDASLFHASPQLAVSGEFVLRLIIDGLMIGIIYALMAIGLTLIFSVLNIVSFAHGEFYMLGGYIVYFFLQTFEALPPLLSIVAAAIVTFAVGFLFERIFLQPMARGEVERPNEYAILVTFGLAFFLQFLMLGLVGPFPKKAHRLFDLPQIEGTFFRTTKATLFLGDITISAGRLFAALIALLALAGLLWFMYRTWTGRALQAVSQDRNAAAVVGINPLNMNTLAFSMGAMLAGLAGAVLVTVYSWVPWVGVPASSKSFVIIVLGGMGSIPGSLLGGLIIGVVESLGTGLFPDPARAQAYRDVFGLVIFALVLLLRPTGLFGRKL
nr:branched-chain amino acid ABC transporter permease [Ardenticatena sp.]